jgi:hypothetical protein
MPSNKESRVFHAAAVLAGLVLMVVGLALMATVSLLPVGVALGLLGLFILGGGLFAHIESPVKIRDMLGAVVSLSGAAIGMTFSLAVALFVVAMSVSVVFLIAGWLRSIR